MIINKNRVEAKMWGVYKVENLINGDFYIGSTTENFIKRCSKHNSDIKRKGDGFKRATCPSLYKAIQEYGTDNFEMIPIRMFIAKKDSVYNEKLVTYIEEKLIHELKPQYNICKFPSRGGLPNLGRKLSDEWKKNISEKSKLYRHKSNSEIYNKKSLQNKELSSIYRIWNDSTSFTGSMTDCCKFTGLDMSTGYKWLSGVNKTSKEGWKIEKLRNQKKSIKLTSQEIEVTLSSFAECDRYLDMWKGFTSTQVVNNKSKILNFNYEVIQ